MNSQSFSSGQTTNINTFGQRSVQPHDASFKLNRVVYQRQDDRASVIHSIDPNAFLKLLEKDQLSELYKTTLVGWNTRNGVGIWDTLFNNASRQAFSACIFTARNDFTPIQQSKVQTTAQFLNFSMAVSRVNLSQITAGDRVGIGINDMTQNVVYILLYIVEEQCSVSSPEVDRDGRPSLLPAFNIRMEHALRFDYDGNGTFTNMEDDNPYNAEAASPFVQWISYTVQDVANGYPYKPHFLSLPLFPVKRDELEVRLVSDRDGARQVAYEDFVDVCRKAYREVGARNNSRGGQPKPQDSVESGGRRTRRRPSARPQKVEIALPVVEVFNTGGKVYAKLDETSSFGNVTYSFDETELAQYGSQETFLKNLDLDGTLVGESSNVLVLSEQTFGDNSYLRYLSVNF